MSRIRSCHGADRSIPRITCQNCKTSKPTEEFAVAPNGQRAALCRACLEQYVAERTPSDIGGAR